MADEGIDYDLSSHVVILATRASRTKMAAPAMLLQHNGEDGCLTVQADSILPDLSLTITSTATHSRSIILLWDDSAQ